MKEKSSKPGSNGSNFSLLPDGRQNTSAMVASSSSSASSSSKTAHEQVAETLDKQFISLTSVSGPSSSSSSFSNSAHQTLNKAQVNLLAWLEGLTHVVENITEFPKDSGKFKVLFKKAAKNSELALLLKLNFGFEKTKGILKRGSRAPFKAAYEQRHIMLTETNTPSEVYPFLSILTEMPYARSGTDESILRHLSSFLKEETIVNFAKLLYGPLLDRMVSQSDYHKEPFLFSLNKKNIGIFYSLFSMINEDTRNQIMMDKKYGGERVAKMFFDNNEGENLKFIFNHLSVSVLYTLLDELEDVDMSTYPPRVTGQASIEPNAEKVQLVISIFERLVSEKAEELQSDEDVNELFTLLKSSDEVDLSVCPPRLDAPTNAFPENSTSDNEFDYSSDDESEDTATSASSSSVTSEKDNAEERRKNLEVRVTLVAFSKLLSTLTPRQVVGSERKFGQGLLSYYAAYVCSPKNLEKILQQVEPDFFLAPVSFLKGLSVLEVSLENNSSDFLEAYINNLTPKSLLRLLLNEKSSFIKAIAQEKHKKNLKLVFRAILKEFNYQAVILLLNGTFYKRKESATTKEEVEAEHNSISRTLMKVAFDESMIIADLTPEDIRSEVKHKHRTDEEAKNTAKLFEGLSFIGIFSNINDVSEVAADSSSSASSSSSSSSSCTSESNCASSSSNVSAPLILAK